jgi:hypothetical protein
MGYVAEAFKCVNAFIIDERFLCGFSEEHKRSLYSLEFRQSTDTTQKDTYSQIFHHIKNYLADEEGRNDLLDEKRWAWNSPLDKKGQRNDQVQRLEIKQIYEIEEKVIEFFQKHHILS